MDNLSLHFAPIFYHLVMFFVINDYFLRPQKLAIKKHHNIIIDFSLKTVLATSFIVSVYVPIFHKVDGEVLWHKDPFLFVATLVIYGGILVFAWVIDINRKQINLQDKKPPKKSDKQPD